VKLALRAVDTSWSKMVATKQAVFAATDALCNQQREDGGEALRPEFVQLSSIPRTARGHGTDHVAAISTTT